uniref:Uncharacterized protein n=1 Tax=Rhizophora mucronata TaxID=61149 RepID=A0A2P2J3B9_RHIMU
MSSKISLASLNLPSRHSPPIILVLATTSFSGIA